ncbi:glycerophosphodiester phosphodiesterase family protein [Sporosarcina thermotolerans]|uniref:Glycerophosphodiester phosphodiesterase family protein n=1 Tax=Sporosarcina thermotolerans TaxID=633404 RepID=A0AAW9A7D2_9BACL|nr:glycerophosphodiester phosphodiesterase family protein [Sporosarcina thermotolerans]MDW0116870.1 glycerophosphodiester phosphodiesterase family protein [Sporosarcina thermotolerans]WHT48005.1 glycerophosphodiester phosphodiesterase family protein [Sporosarcina thermotolerans]
MNKLFLVILLALLSACSPQPAKLPDDDFLIIAHRGASAYAPEHSLLAYELAVKMRADYIELDVHMTKDGELVSIHDSFIDGLDSKKAIKDITFNELKLVPRESTFKGPIPVFFPSETDLIRIVSTEEIFSHFRDEVNYYIEIKSPQSYPGIEEVLLKQLRDYGLLFDKGTVPQVILQSFDADSLKKVHKLEPSIPLIQLYSVKNETIPTKRKLRKIATYASGIGINENLVTAEFVKLVHGEKLHLHPYTVNEEEAIRRMIELGVDGVFTDVPDKVEGILEGMK